MTLVWFCLFGFAQETEGGDDFQEVVNRLAAEGFGEREAAVEALITTCRETPHETLPRVVGLLKHPDPEIRFQATRVIGPFTGLEWMDPGEAGKKRSGPSGAGVSLTFINQSEKPMQVYWIDFSGEHQKWRGLIAPGASARCDRSYPSHVWLITDDKKVGQGVYVLGEKDSRIIHWGAKGNPLR